MVVNVTSQSLDIAARIAPELVDLRRRLHEIPELGNDLPKTQKLLLEALDGLPIEITLGQSLSSIVGVIRGTAAGMPPSGDRANVPSVLLRGDMDGLPVTEVVDVDYVSTHPGLMHACGHDLHMAALVGAAQILCERRDELQGDVVLMFQPGEEGPGGAEPMLAEGLLEASGTRVSAAYALHVFSAEFEKGVWFGRPGPLMAAADEVYVRVVGKGGHGSQPHRAKDPIPAACEMVLALQTMVTRTFDVFDPVVITVGKFASGTKDNIIPDDAFFEMTVRTLSPENREMMQERIPSICKGIAAAHGLDIEVDYHLNYPVTVNDEAEQAFAESVIVDLFGADRWTDQVNPELGSEDMSYVLNEVPGAYVNLSAVVADPAAREDNHSTRAAFDDSVLGDAAAFLAEVALRRLAR